MQSMNQELMMKLQEMEDRSEMIEQSMASSATEMMGLASEDGMSMNSGFMLDGAKAGKTRLPAKS